MFVTFSCEHVFAFVEILKCNPAAPLSLIVTVNESQMEIPAERGQDFVWRVEQRNKKTYFKFEVGENREKCRILVNGICRD